MDFKAPGLVPLDASADAHGPEVRPCIARLDAVQSTLLIPLVARALGERLFPDMAVNDADARRALAALGTEPQDDLHDRLSIYGVLARTRILRQLAQDFFRRHPRGWGVNLGCGLSSYFQWLDRRRNQWLDADLPAVTALREHLLPSRGQRHRNAALDLRLPHWWQTLGLPQGPKAPAVLVLLEGVLMYLQPTEVRNVLREFATHAPAGSELLLDSLSWMAVGHAGLHPSVSKTEAQFHWGARRMQDFTDSHPRLQLLGEHSVLDSYDPAWSCLCPLFRATWGVPLYAVIHLGLRS